MFERLIFIALVFLFITLATSFSAAARLAANKPSYLFVGNNGIGNYDKLGLLCCYACVGFLQEQIFFPGWEDDDPGYTECRYAGQCFEGGNTCNGSKSGMQAFTISKQGDEFCSPISGEAGTY